jgi:iron complex outermembrane receptor protein
MEKTISWASVLLASAALPCQPIWAQTVQGGSLEQSETERDSVGIDDIIVTANKRQESLQKVPIAISAFGADMVENSRISSIDDVVARVPAFFASNAFRTQASLGMRGAAALEDSPGSDQAVAVFVDEIYLGENSGMDFDFFDIERIEVLRGPQGTLFGRNVMGGAVNIISRTPSDKPDAKFEASYGRFNQFNLRGMASGPLIGDVLLGQIAFSSKNSDGYTKNLFTGKRLNQEDLQSGRVKFLFQPNKAFDATLTVNYMRDRSQGVVRKLEGDVPAILFQPPGLSEVSQNVDGGYDRRAAGVTLRLDYEVGGATLTSISGYRNSKHKLNVDLDGTSVEIGEFVLQENRIKQLSQEFRVAGSTGSLDYVAGLYYLNLKIARDEYLFLQGLPGSLFDVFVGGVGSRDDGTGQSIRTRSYAGFGQVTWHASDRLRLTAGARYTRENKAGETYCFQDSALCAQYRLAVGDTFKAFTPKLVLDYDLSKDILLYGSVSRGFKGGGFASNFPDEASARAGGSFGPEFAWSYEAGVKARWLDNRLQTNLTVYRVDYSDLQVREQEGVYVIVGNAGKSRVNGVEVEILTRPATGIELFGNYAYTDGKYNRLILEGQDYSGNRLVLTPRHAFTIGGSYRLENERHGALNLRTDLQYKSLTYTDVANTDYQSTRLNGILNASISYTFPGGNWEITAFGDNLTNFRTRTTSNDISVFYLPEADLAAGKHVVSADYSPPTTYGVSLRWTF